MLAPSKPPQLATVAGTMVSLLLLLLLGFVYFVDMIPSNILITQNVIADDTSKPDNDAAGVVLGPARIENIAPYPAKTIYRTKTDLKDRLIVTEGTVGHMSSRGFLLADDAKGH